MQWALRGSGLSRIPLWLSLAVSSIAAVSFSGKVLAQRVPVPPCAGAAVPMAAAIGASLNQLVWMDDELPAEWSLPTCTGWNPGPSKVLLAAAGRFQMAGDSDVLAARLARISRLTDLVYWSSSRGRWRNLFAEAVALSGPDRKARRADFSQDDIVSDALLHYWVKEDNPTAGVVYRMRVRERTPDRLVFEHVNLTAVRGTLLLLRIKVADPGEFRQLYYIEREDEETWRYYSLVRLGKAGTLAGTSPANYRNRAEGYFRFLAGLRMDREPPAAP
jgi:hypothetical protein